MENHISREAAVELLKKYNKDSFHFQHALTVEGIMRWYAKQLGFAQDEDFWGIVGLLHDIDFEMYPEEHCIKAPELLREAGVGEEMIHAICSHAYGMHVDIKPEHTMEKVLFATDELTGLIWAAALMRPSLSTQDMELKSLKKKYKSKGFAAGCSRDVIEKGAEMLGWPLDELLQKTLDAMKVCETKVLKESALWQDMKKESRAARRGDWKTEPMPEQHETFILDRSFTDNEMDALRRGNIPQAMEDKWFWYMEGSTFWAHRSWTGYCIYKIEFKADNHHVVTVNRNPEQYKCTSVEEDIESLNKLLDQWICNSRPASRR